MNLLAALLAILPAVHAADFVPPDTKEIVTQARAGAAEAELAAFLDNLGDGVYEGSSGELSRDGAAYDLIETRVIVQRKTLHGHPGATLRLLRRAALKANPAHVESADAELSLEIAGGSLLVLRDGKADAAAHLDQAPSAHAVVATWRDAYYRYHPEVVETLSLTLKDGVLIVERARSTGGSERERESFSAARR